MGRVGSCFDNAVSEAFNSVLKVEYVHRHTFATRAAARIRIATWITDFYNTRDKACAWPGRSGATASPPATGQPQAALIGPCLQEEAFTHSPHVIGSPP
ncbi:hypothetical protein GCM10011578_051250 [Streptomyces fuscichromogenes]|uniref:Integrase catalytic domain-containing protein n=2 Tax=Streptomyces fuscichromogenes TaxID=1324013 RepID=A0A917XFK0_9ACTN|nr:hypothetical protein GCM10011578_051250 [Streptomyces fuscichromogenes]